MRYKNQRYSAKWLLLPAIAYCFMFSKCRKEEPLPEFYFRCKVNGNDYRPNNCSNCSQADFLGDTTFLLGGNRDFEHVGLGYKDLDGIKPGTYLLTKFGNKKGGGGYKNSTLTIDKYETDSIFTGVLSITSINKLDKTIQGTFTYNAFNEYRKDSVRITEGKFRLRYSDH